MKQVVLKPLHHNGQECLGIYFENSSVLNGVLRKKAGASWSQSNRCWYVPLSKGNYNKVFLALKGLATIDQSSLHQYLAEQKKQSNHLIQKSPNTSQQEVVIPWTGQEVIQYRKEKISSVNAHVLPAMRQHLQLKAYSISTVKTYLNEMSQLLTVLKDVPADQLTVAHLKRYLVFCFEKLQLKENTLHSRINAMKFYYEQVLGREKFFWEIPRPKKPLLLPRLLNETELARLFNALTNKKHKAMLFTAYSAGLRVSEIVNLKLTDIDSGRMQLLIRHAKGKKDRYVNLSPILLDILRAYFKEIKIKPKEYLFESDQTRTAYPARTVQQIFSQAKQKAGIKKQVGIHSLRHSFATHLLDKGTDIRYIKDLLGHFDIRTTERYLHVSKKQLVNVVSPFDDLWKKASLEW